MGLERVAGVGSAGASGEGSAGGNGGSTVMRGTGKRPGDPA